jgi:CRISPR/Cas system-associated exonuclease Cas4 (RecB family)
MFEDIYNNYLLHLNEENRKDRYEGKESWYHASGAGFCSRKLYFESVERAEPTNPPNKRSMRVMGLGTVIHNEIQSSLLYNINNINNTNNTNNNINKVNIAKYSMHNFHTEGEIELPNLNVRGYYDIVMEDCIDSKDNPYIRLYDVKTISNYGFKQKFGKYALAEPSRNHYMQLATYGLAVKDKFGNLDSMDLIYYNKDDSRMKKQSVPLDYINKARRYWHVINEEHSKGLPVFNLGTSPTQKWMCGYCQFKDHCKPPSFK